MKYKNGHLPIMKMRELFTIILTMYHVYRLIFNMEISDDKVKDMNLINFLVLLHRMSVVKKCNEEITL